MCEESEENVPDGVRNLKVIEVTALNAARLNQR